jgi:hypothetical protein
MSRKDSKDSKMTRNTPNAKFDDDGLREIMSRSWWSFIEWQTPLIMIGGGAILMLIYAVQGKSLRPVVPLMIGALAVERFAWAAWRVWWRHKHRDKQTTRVR